MYLVKETWKWNDGTSPLVVFEDKDKVVYHDTADLTKANGWKRRRYAEDRANKRQDAEDFYDRMVEDRIVKITFTVCEV